MATAGKGINEKILKRVNDFLIQWLEKDEDIIGVFRASLWSPPSEGFALTNKRLIIVDKLILKTNKVVNEVAADDIAEFTSEKGTLKARKAYLIKKDGAKIYLGSMYKDDALILSNFLSKMSGRPVLTAEKIQAAKIAESDAKKEEKVIKAQRKTKKLQDKKSTIKLKSKKLLRNTGFVLFWPSFVAYRLKIGKELKEAKISERLQQRASFENDQKILIKALLTTIRKHWDVLQDKLELHAGEDDYGNTLLGTGFEKEFVYFSEKIVLPELKRQISERKTSYSGLSGELKDVMLPEEIKNQIDFGVTTDEDVTYFLLDTMGLLRQIPKDYYGINFSDSDDIIADKLISSIGERMIDDELFYGLQNNGAVKSEYLTQTTLVFMQNPSITLDFGDNLKTHRPMKVTPFVGLVFVLFSALHNNNTSEKPIKRPLAKSFIGNDPYKYEDYIKTLLRNEGFVAKRTRGSGDFGVDVMARKNGTTFAIQCKLYNHTVGTKAVQEIVSGRIYYKADYAVVVSDNKFTDAAKQLARKSGVILAHHKNLLHKLESIIGEKEIPAERQQSIAYEPERHTQENTSKKEWSKDDADELVTVILPTIRNDQ